MFDNTVRVEEGREQIQAERQEMPLSFVNKEYKEDIESRKKDDDDNVISFWEPSDAEQSELLQKTLEGEFIEAMYDYGLGERSTEGKIITFYGWDILRRVRKETRGRNIGDVSPALIKIMKDVRAGKITSKSKIQKPIRNDNPQKPYIVPNKTIQREKRPGDKYFLMKKRGTIRNEAYRKMFKGPGTVYEWLWANLVRSPWIDTKGYPIKEQYFDNGLLVYCSSYRKIGKNCFLHKNKVKKYIDAFREAGIIKVEHLTPVGKIRGQSVFILGEWKVVGNGIKEIFYIDGVFPDRKDGQNVPN